MVSRIERLLIRRFCSKPGPLSYLVMLASFATGVFFGLFWFADSVHETFIYQTNVLGNPQWWGAGLLLGSTLVIYGLYKRHKNAVRWGAMLNFIMWLFAAISYATNQIWVSFVTIAVFHLAVQAHFYLSASFDTLFPRR